MKSVELILQIFPINRTACVFSKHLPTGVCNVVSSILYATHFIHDFVGLACDCVLADSPSVFICQFL